MRSEGAGAAGHQYATPRAPAARRFSGEGGADQPAGVDTGAAHGELVLVADATEDSGEPRGGPLVQVVGVVGEVDEATPALRVFESDDPSEPPDLRSRRTGGPVGGAGGDGSPGQQPQRCLDRRVTEGLGERERARQTGRHIGPLGVRTRVVREERQHTPYAGGQVVGGGAQPQGECGAVGVRRVPRYADDGGAVRGQGVLDAVVGRAVRGCDEEPAALQVG